MLEMREAQERLGKPLERLGDQIGAIRSGTVSQAFVETVKVTYFGSRTPLQQLATFRSMKDQIAIQPYDRGVLAAAEKALRSAGLNAYVSAKDTVLVSIPPITGEEREKVCDHVRRLGEETKVAIRNVRRDLRKRLENLAKDDLLRAEKRLLEATDEMCRRVDSSVRAKCESI